jgi:hypothetical protein
MVVVCSVQLASTWSIEYAAIIKLQRQGAAAAIHISPAVRSRNFAYTDILEKGIVNVVQLQ